MGGRTLSDEARRVLRERFVGRDTELDLFDGLLTGAGSKILWVFGPGGIGKSTLLRCFADRAGELGCSLLSVDLRAVDPSRHTLIAALTAPSVPPTPTGRLVVLIDTVERVPGCEEWIRSAVLPGYPEGTMVVVASRLPPPVAWRTDELSGPLTTTVALRGLSLDEGCELLVRQRVPATDARRGARIARGHPLALSMLSEALAAGAQLERLDDAPDLVATLLEHILGDVPDDDHRQALEVCAIARVTTRSLLRSVLPDAHAGAVHEWLATRPYIDRLPDGLCPHDLVRDLLVVDLRASDPQRYQAQQLAIRQYLLDRQSEAGMAGTLAADLVYLHRFSSSMSSFWDWGSFGSGHETPLTPDDHDAVEAIIAAHNPPELLPVLRYWMRRQPEAFGLARVGDELMGVYALLILSGPHEDDLAHDPSLGAVWEHARSIGRVRDGEVIGYQRFFDDRVAGQGPASLTFNVMSAACTRHWMLGRQVVDYIATIRDIDSWVPMFDYLDFRRAASADTSVGEAHVGVVWRDWRNGGRAAWLDTMEGRELGGSVHPARDTPVLVALSEADFAEAVRDALRDLNRPDRLRGSPLLASRVVREVDGSDRVAQLVSVFHAALGRLPDDPRTAKARRALDRTYFHGAVSQEAAAEVLDMAFSTYRRHLKAGVELLVDQLWRWEVYGRSEDTG